MNIVRNNRATRATLITSLLVLVLASCSDDAGRDIITEDEAGSVTAAEESASVPGGATSLVPPTTSPSPVVSAETTVPAPDTPGTSDPSMPPVASDPRNVYAFAAAQAIADAANDEGLEDADEETIPLVLETASEVAYAIEYPIVVEYLEIDIDEDVVTITTEGDFGNGLETGTAYVCIVDGRATATETACRP